MRIYRNVGDPSSSEERFVLEQNHFLLMQRLRSTVAKSIDRMRIVFAQARCHRKTTAVVLVMYGATRLSGADGKAAIRQLLPSALTSVH
jgi:hypothetical protein